MDLLDIGAGNGWFSYRMAVKAHRPVAVDLLVNDLDGLGAARHYFHFLSQPFPCFQAEMDRLPFDDGQFDVVVFNASFHYSEDYTYTLGEALRCLRRPGHVLIIDSPFYRWEESGRQMVQERRAEFERKYGFRSDSVPSREYVTLHMLDELRNIHGIRWRILRPWYGLSWLIRPLRAKFRRRREPAQFFLVWGTIESP
jgi:SAM-dependent methyltransferase